MLSISSSGIYAPMGGAFSGLVRRLNVKMTSYWAHLVGSVAGLGDDGELLVFIVGVGVSRRLRGDLSFEFVFVFVTWFWFVLVVVVVLDFFFVELFDVA